MRRPKIAYLTVRQALGSSGGIEFFSAQALAKWADVKDVGPLGFPIGVCERVRNRLRRFAALPRYPVKYSLSVARRQGALATRQLQSVPHDLVWSAFPGPIAFVESAVPRVLYTDLTIPNICELPYDVVADLAPAALRMGQELERRAIARADVVFCRNHWCAKSVVDDYGKSSDRVVVIPSGANIREVPDAERVQCHGVEPGTPFVLLFVGLNWAQKGGDVVIQMVRELRHRGRDVSVLLIGEIPETIKSEPGVTVIGRLDKSQSDDWLIFDAAFKHAHMLVLPTQQEACALVFSEACAYGLPVLTTDIGGVHTAIDETCGIVLPRTADSSDYANAITELLDDPERYRQLSFGARRRFEYCLNWDVAATSMQHAIADIGLWTFSCR